MDDSDSLLYSQPFTRSVVLIGDVVLWRRRGEWGLGVVVGRHHTSTHPPAAQWAVEVQVEDASQLRCTTKYFRDSALTTLGPLDDSSPAGLPLRQLEECRLETISKLRAGRLSKSEQSLLADEVERAFALYPYTLGPRGGVHDAVADLVDSLDYTENELEARRSEADELEAVAELLAGTLVVLAPFAPTTFNTFQAKLRELLDGYLMVDRSVVVCDVVELAKKFLKEG